jgi:hypothetical protein
MRNRPQHQRTQARVANPYRLSARMVRGLQAVTGGRLGLETVDSLASVLGRMERRYLQPETHYPDLFRQENPEAFQRDLGTWAATLANMAAVALSRIYSPTVRQHAVMAHEFGCLRFATALRLWWTASAGRVAIPLTEWDLMDDLGHFRWEAQTLLTPNGPVITGDQIRWVSSRHYEITRLLGGAPEL